MAWQIVVNNNICTIQTLLFHMSVQPFLTEYSRNMNHVKLISEYNPSRSFKIRFFNLDTNGFLTSLCANDKQSHMLRVGTYLRAIFVLVSYGAMFF